MVDFKQADRWLKVSGLPFGPDDLLPTEFSGREALSTPFQFSLHCVSSLAEIAPEKVLGKPVTVHAGGAGTGRVFNGIIASLRPLGSWTRDLHRFEFEIVPSIWLLTLGRDLRIFQEKTTLDIVKEIFSDHKITDFDTKGVQKSLEKLEYCVQYRETHFDFVSRLLEEEGIFYYFEHSDSSHVLKLADNTAVYADLEPATVPMHSAAMLNGIHAWAPRFEQRSGIWTLRDYDFVEPAIRTSEQKTIVKKPAFKMEVYDYPGRFTQKTRGDFLAGRRMEAHEAGFHEVSGEATVPAFVPGKAFKRDQPGETAQDPTRYALIEVAHVATDHSHIAGEGQGGQSYTNSFVCIPATTVFRSDQVTPRPVVAGPHTALVVGPSGEEIHTDRHGRVKVQFHWDRKGENDDKSTCFIRVAQAMAGKNWGAIYLPRIGMEVVVDFLEGDPDRPLIVGCVYNGANPPPYALPANKTQSGLKSRSSPKGGTEDFNELRFEDKKGEEQVYFHAQKDFERYVEDADTLTVEKGDRTVTLEQGSETVTIQQGDQTVKIDKGNQTTTLGQGDHTLKMSAGQSTTDAAQKITLKVGGSTVVVEPAKITLKSVQIEIKGQAQIKLSAPMVDISGSAMVKVQGGIVKIN